MGKMISRYGIGLMSGTSGDGVDAALVDFADGKVRIAATHFLPYPAKLREEVFRASQPDGPAELICRLNVEIGKLFGTAAVALCKKAKIPLKQVEFIGSHGQTIRHQPNGKNGVSSTLQIGEGSEIAALTGCWVVSDFRPADIAAGGCGAPLAPLAHYVLFSDKNEDRVVHNMGGISNITWLPAGVGIEGVTGFDTGPANMLLDMASAHLSKGKRAYDKNGATALHGAVDKKMYAHCMAHPYFKRKPPKSTGRETFGPAYFAELLKKFGTVKEADFLRTLAAAAASSAVDQVFAFCKPRRALRWIVCGGGAYNKALLDELRARLAGRGAVTMSSELGYGEKDIEAVLMAALAYRTINGLHGNIPKVTGAKRPALLGKISIP
ncbi:MAG: anhydro-N-acetylmuramic acid kinase [Nitrospinae bacterium]|nr:anhydro-N-acetylmuramic acid kinase [Nitrospinota bacterium]